MTSGLLPALGQGEKALLGRGSAACSVVHPSPGRPHAPTRYQCSQLLLVLDFLVSLAGESHGNVGRIF